MLSNLELFYTFGLSGDFADETFSHTRVALQDKAITGGINVFSKHHFSEKSYFYASYGLGYFRYAYQKSHTVCTEVGDPVGGLCPCLNFSENIYKRNVNQLSSEIRLGVEFPHLDSYDRLHFDLFYGVGARVMSVSEPNYLSHVLCSDDLINPFTQEVLPEKFNKSTKYTAAGNKAFFVYPIVGIKLGYAF